MNRIAFAMLATAGFACTPAFAVVTPTGDAGVDTAAIQQEIDAAPDGTVELASGTFALNKAITISNGASLVGVGSAPGDVVLSLVTQVADDGDWNVLKIEGSGETVVSNLTVTTGGARWDNGFGPKSGIEMDSGLVVDCVIRDCTTRNNKYAGAGVYMTGGTLRRCLVAGCNSLDSGGGGMSGEGVYMTGGLAENCTVVSNGSTNVGYMGSAGSGGAVYVRNAVLRNCLVADNRNRVGASGVTAREGSTVENCTIAGNRQNCADATAYGVDISGKNITFRNNIIWDNSAFDGSIANVRIGSDTYTFENNDTKPLLSVGTGNICVDPEFVDASSCDYHIGYSYCTDSGVNLEWMVGAVDLDGNSRVHNGVVNMGCYEGETPSEFACRMSVVYDETSSPATVELMWGATGAAADYAEWSFTRQEDNAKVGATGDTTQIELGPGTWDVELKVVRGVQAVYHSKQAAVIVQCTKVYANEKGSGEFPYDTVEKGLPSINDALQALAVGGTLYVAAGNYVISSCINLDGGRGTRIESIDGPEATVVRLANVELFNDGHNNGDFGLRLSCDSAYVSGITFVGGRKGPYYDGDEYKSRGLVRVSESGAVVTNCVFRDLKCLERVWCTGLEITKGTVVDCRFACIDSSSSGGAVPQGGVICIRGGLVDRTRIEDCRARASNTGAGGNGDIVGVWGSGVLRNSLITRCSSEHDTPVYVGAAPGASTGGYLENCTIVANTNLFADVKDGLWYAAGVAVIGGSVTNCIIVDNWSVHGNAVSNIYNSAGAAGIGYTLVNDRAGDATFVTAENHNVAVQPGARLFRRPENGDYSLATGSPAINVGLKFDWMETASDLAGNSRVIARIPDLGCYEGRMVPFTIRLR